MQNRKQCTIGYRDPTHVAGAVEEPAAGYGPGSSAYSPMLSAGLDASGYTELVHQMDSPEKATQDTPVIKLPRPPATNVGGEPGRSQPLGFTDGMLPSRTFRQPFRGATLVRPSMGVHPATGPVGLSNRQGRLQANVAALVDTYLPPAQNVREMFTQPRNRNPIADAVPAHE